MNTPTALVAEKVHLAQLLDAIQPRTYFLHAAATRVDWALVGATLQARKIDVSLFGFRDSFNERFAKLQDMLGAAIRYACLLLGESTESFLMELAFYSRNKG